MPVGVLGGRIVTMLTILASVGFSCAVFAYLQYSDARYEKYLEDLEKRMLAAFNRGEIRTDEQLRNFK